MAHQILKGKYFGLLLSLTVLGVLYPILEANRAGLTIWTIGFWLVLLGGQRAVGPHPRIRSVTRVLALATLATGITAMATTPVDEPNHFVLALLGMTSLTFLGVTTVVVLGDVLSGDRVDADKILGSVCVYILVGVTFAFMFLVLSCATGESATSPAAVAPTCPINLYFSFVTLTTLGYGDMAPVGPFARLFASVEAVTGQIYLTILVARLVGLHIQQSPAQS